MLELLDAKKQLVLALSGSAISEIEVESGQKCTVFQKCSSYF